MDRPSAAPVTGAAPVAGAPPDRMPDTGHILVAAVVALALSLGLDALFVAAGTTLFPGTRGYSHFRFYDYGGLTALGVLVGCCAWPIIVRRVHPARPFFLRLAVAVTLALWLPDLYLLFASHEPIKAVGVLMVMHLGVAVATYNSLVRLAPEREAAGTTERGVVPGANGHEGVGSPASELEPERVGDLAARRRARLGRAATALLVLVGIELVAGVAALLAVPAGRPSGVVPAKGSAIYLVHALLGFPLAIGAVALVLAARRLEDRHLTMMGWTGLVGVALAGAGGAIAVSHPLRLLGIGLMFVGPLVAAFAYFLPLLDRLHEHEVARLAASSGATWLETEAPQGHDRSHRAPDGDDP